MKYSPENMNKEDWRKKSLLLRDALTEEERKQKSAGIMSRLLNSGGYADAGVVACYASFDCQVFAELTGMEEHDIRPDFLFTETGEQA